MPRQRAERAVCLVSRWGQWGDGGQDEESPFLSVYPASGTFPVFKGGYSPLGTWAVLYPSQNGAGVYHPPPQPPCDWLSPPSPTPPHQGLGGVSPGELPGRLGVRQTREGSGPGTPPRRLPGANSGRLGPDLPHAALRGSQSFTALCCLNKAGQGGLSSPLQKCGNSGWGWRASSEGRPCRSAAEAVSHSVKLSQCLSGSYWMQSCVCL